MQSATGYVDQTWFSSGYGNELQQNKIKKYWDEDKYITSAAYILDGWLVTMANCHYTDQSYNYTRVVMAVLVSEQAVMEETTEVAEAEIPADMDTILVPLVMVQESVLFVEVHPKSWTQNFWGALQNQCIQRGIFLFSSYHIYRFTVVKQG